MARIGQMPCPVPGCGCPDAVVKETPTGTLGVECHRCGFSGYGKQGTKAKRLLAAATTPDEGDPPAPTGGPPAPTPPAPPAPAASPYGKYLR